MLIKRNHPGAEQFNVGAAIHGPLNCFQSIDLALGLPTAPGFQHRVSDSASCSQTSSFSIELPINKPRNRIASWRMMVNSADSIFSASTLAICWGVICPRGFTQSAAAVSGEILRSLGQPSAMTPKLEAE